MTISSSTRKAGPFIGNGVTTSFPFSFKVFQASDIQVIKTSTSGVDSTLVLNSDYTISLNADQNASPGGTITYPISGPPLQTEKLTATGVLSALQGTHITNGGNFFANNIEDQMDYLTILVQQLSEQLSRVALASSSDLNPVLSIGTAVQRALKYITFDASGNISLAQALPSGTLSQASIAAFLNPQTAAEVSASVTPTNLVTDTRVALTPQRFGAVGDGVNNDTTALQNWLTVLGKSSQVAFGYLPAGTYKHTGALSVPQGVYIQGAGTLLSILKPATGFVGVALTTANNAKLKALTVDGTNAPAQTGLNLAPVNPDFNEIEDVWVQNFSANAGIGVLVQNSVRLSAKRLVSISNGTNMKLLSQTPASLPTTCVFSACRFASATGTPGGTGMGVLINSGFSIVFDENCVFENNIQQGVLAQSVAGGIVQDLKLEECWFENNWAGHVDTGTKVYSFQLDGAAGSGANAHLADVRFSQGVGLSDRKSVLVNNASCTWESLRCQFGFASDFVVTGAGSYVQVVDDPADRNGRFISNANGANVQYPLYKPVIDLGTGLSVLPTIQKIVGLAYSAAMTPDISLGDSFVVSVSNTTAFTVNAPTNVSATLDPGKRINFKIRNVSGNNVLGVLTWNAVFKLAAWTQPQNNFSHSIDFIWDGTNWCESCRTTTQVPT